MAPATTIQILADALIDLIGKPGHKIDIIWTRHGEKLYEALLSREELYISEDMGNYYRIPADLRDLNYSKFVEIGEENISHSEDYNSHNTSQLNLLQMKELLKKISINESESFL